MNPILNSRQLFYLSEFSAFARGYGLPNSVAKILGLLLICNPPQQTAQSIQQTLKLSTGSVNTGVTLLAKMGMVERARVPGSNQYSYEIMPDNFQQAILGRLKSARESKKLAEKGLEIDDTNERLIAMRDVFGLIETELPHIIQKLNNH